MIPLWRSYKSYLYEKFGETVYRIGVDGGFSCPNRGMDRRNPGCSFCTGSGARAPYTAGETNLVSQVTSARAFLQERYGARSFSLYFQAYSSTWAPRETLKKIYDLGLSLGPFREFIVSTRPDCLGNEEIALLKSYQSETLDVWVELGLQSCQDKTLARIRRGHDSQVYLKATEGLRKAGLRICTHLIYGLPGESLFDFLNSVLFTVRSGASGIKFHNLLIPPGTAMADEASLGMVRMPDMEDYLEALAQALTLLPPDMVVMRLQSDYEGREDELPGEVWPKNKLIHRLEKLMKSRGWTQGCRRNLFGDDGLNPIPIVG